MTTSAARRRRRVAIGLVLALGALCLGVAWAYRHLTDPARLREVVRAALQPAFDGEVAVGGVQFAFPDQLTILDASVRASGGPPSSPADRKKPWPSPTGGAGTVGEVFHCPRIEARFRPADLLRSRWVPTSLVLRGPVLNVTGGLGSVGGAFGPLIRGRSTDDAPRIDAPRIEIDHARVAIRAEPESPPVQLAFSVRGLRSPTDRYILDLAWSATEGGETGRLQLDLRQRRLRSVEGALPALPIETLFALARRSYTEGQVPLGDVKLRGAVRVTEFDIRPDGNPDNESLAVEFSDASLSLPLGPRDRSPAEARGAESDRVSLTEAKGRIAMQGQALSANASASFRGSDVSLVGRFDFDRGATDWIQSFEGELEVGARSLRLPRIDDDAPAEERRLIQNSQLLSTIYRDYDPHGVVDLDLRVVKERNAGWRIERGLLTAVDGDASCRFRPYRGRGVRGSIEFTPRGVWVRDLVSERDGGTIVVNAQVLGFDRCAACEVEVRADRLPIDEMLLGAVPPQFVAVAQDFQLSGRVGVLMRAQRPACAGSEPGEWTSHTSVSLDGVSATYKGFPYPVVDLHGEMVLAGGELRLNALEGRHGSGIIEASGTVDVTASGVAAIDLSLRGRDLVLDGAFIDALPSGVREQWSEFQLAGNLDTSTHVFLDADTHRLGQETVANLRAVSMRHARFPLPWTGIAGRIRVTSDRIETDSLQGQCHGAKVHASGWLSPSGDAGSWHVGSDAFAVDDTVSDALPASWRQRLDGWRIEGPVALNLRADRTTGAAERGWEIGLSAALAGATVRRREFERPFEDVRGLISIDETGARSTSLHARFDASRLRAAFETTPTESGQRGYLSLSADGLRLGSWIQDLLPARLHSAWTAVDPSGAADVNIDRLDFDTTGPPGEGTWTVDGRIDLHDVSLRGSPAIAGLNGRISGFGFLRDRRGGTTLRGDVALDSIAIQERLLTQARADWSLATTDDHLSTFGLDRIEAHLFGGTVTGQLEATSEETEARYNLSATAQGVGIKPWLDAARRAARLEPVPQDLRGDADAHLYLSGRFGDEASRRGGGLVEIRNARIYRLPILLAVLSVLNVSIPEQEAFDAAEASFYVVGNRMHFNDIELRGPSLALLGTGFLSLPDQGLVVDLFSVNPRQWARVPGLSDIMEGTSRQLVGIQVTGSVKSPIVRVKPLHGITDEFRRVFQKKKPTPLRPTTG